VLELVKNALGDTSSLIIGWMLPTYVSLQLIAALILPGFSYIPMVSSFLHEPAASRQLALLAAAVVTGIVLAAAHAPLYRILEGYLLWPAWLRGMRIKKHQSRRRKLVSQQQALAGTEHGVQAGLVYELSARYPVQDRQFAPTALGNAIRRFETYAGDRYQLDSQLLWHDLRSAAPDRAVAAVSTARTNVDFFICLLYGGVLSILLSVAVAVSGHAGPRTWTAIGVGVVIIVVAYRLAIVATDEWDAAVRAMINHGRAGVAAAFGLQIPSNFASERFMWRAVNTLVRRPYAYSETKDVAAIITQFRKLIAEESPPPTLQEVITGLVNLSQMATPLVSDTSPGAALSADGAALQPPADGRAQAVEEANIDEQSDSTEIAKPEPT
jgi:hypothetical protein